MSLHYPKTNVMRDEGGGLSPNLPEAISEYSLKSYNTLFPLMLHCNCIVMVNWQAFLDPLDLKLHRERSVVFLTPNSSLNLDI